nr:unnamed protein product [Digitaria exilis]
METPPPSGVRLPCLAFNHGKYSDAPILFNLSERKAVASDMDELTGNDTTWATPHGWLLVHRHRHTFLWNPSNGDKIQLPPLPDDDVPSADCICLLSDKPAVAGCVVVLFEIEMDPVMWYCHVGDSGEGWTRHEYDIGTQILYPDETLHEKLVITPVTSCHGKLYFISTGFHELGVIEFPPAAAAAASPAFSSIAMREVVTGGFGVAHSALVFMVESKDEVHMVNLLFDGSFSSVAFLLSPVRFGASRPAAECGLEEDCVYVASYPWDKGLMIYNVREGTIKLENLEEAPESGSGTPLWMLPAES